MDFKQTCPICLNDEFDIYTDRKCIVHEVPECGIYKVSCSICGDYLLGDVTAPILENLKKDINRVKRAAVSHLFKLNTLAGIKNTLYQQQTDLIEFFDRVSLPSPWMQSIAIIRFIGNSYKIHGVPLKVLPKDFHSIIGVTNREGALLLINQLIGKKLIDCKEKAYGLRLDEYHDYYLTIEGWQLFEEDVKGKVSGNYGFIALKIGDAELDKLIKKTIQPVGIDIGYEIKDLIESAQAGIIDNIMRNVIRNSAFVLVDLTHDNNGAYWEAGYAEGLGKPVIYICKKDKFDKKSTHFDTNHCTTVTWNSEETWKDGIDIEFREKLRATLIRSLNL